MKFSVTMLLLAVWACLAHEGHAQVKTKSFAPDTKVSLLRSKRVVGGNLAPHVPWQAMVYLGESIMEGGFAGGALISDRRVLTAGRNLFVKKDHQEIQGKAPLLPKVYLGIKHKSEATASNEHAVERVVLHPRFQNQTNWDNNLALIQLKEQVVMSNRVMPIPLPERGQSLADNINGSGVIAGWGFGVYLTQAPSLKHLVLSIADLARYKAEYENKRHTVRIDHNMFCTGPSKFQENVCTGDAGGALAVTDAESGDIYAAGILSIDSTCSFDRYAVYMKLSSYVPWIHSVIFSVLSTFSRNQFLVDSENLNECLLFNSCHLKLSL